MTQRVIRLRSHKRSLIIWLLVLNSIYVLFSTFEKALEGL